MIRTSALLGVAVTAAVTVAGCSGGGGSHGSVMPQTTKPSATGRAQATITVRYTQGLHYLKKLPKNAKRRTPQFVDPSGSILTVTSWDINDTNSNDYISATFNVSPNPDGTQNLTAPIVASPAAGDGTYVQVSEIDGNGVPIALGEGIVGPVQPGTTVAPGPLTLYMLPAGIAITTDPINYSDLTAISTSSASPTDWSSCAATNGGTFAVAFDDTGASFLDPSSPVGVGGIPTPQIYSQISDNAPPQGSGTSTVYQNAIGAMFPRFDNASDGITVQLQTYDIDPFHNNVAQPTANGYFHYRFTCG